MDVLLSRTEYHLLKSEYKQTYSKLLLLKSTFQNVQQITPHKYTYDFIRMRPLYGLLQMLLYSILNYDKSNLRWRIVNERNLEDFEEIMLSPVPIDIVDNLVVANHNPTNPVALRHIFETHMTWTNELDLQMVNKGNLRRPTFPHGSRDVVGTSSPITANHRIPSLLHAPVFRPPAIDTHIQIKRKSKSNYKRGKRAKFSNYGKGRQNNQPRF